MQIDRDVILKAKEKLGDRNAFIIAETLGITDFDERNLKCCCPFHQEDHASFIYNPKSYNFHCFGACGRSYDIMDVFMMSQGMTYTQACQKLFELAEIPYSFGEVGVRTRRQYRYPKEVECKDKSIVYEYYDSRCISANTLDYADVRQDGEGNVVFNYYDTNDVLTTVKYRPARKLKKGETKCWCQANSDTTPLLFNMNRVNTTAPLLICEGESDCLSAIEAGFTNTVSVPFGSGNFHWIEENYDWLEQFDEIIICADNDDAGSKMQTQCVFQLGSWRTKVVEIPKYFEKPSGKKIPINDLNEVLYRFGKEKVLEVILDAKDSPVPGVVDFSDIEDVDLDQLDGIPTGLPELDRYLMRLFYGTLNIVTGINGCVSADTEYFNGKRWVPISEYHDGDLVLQYNADGTSTLVKPELYHKYPCDHFWKLKSEYGVDQLVSDEHNVVYLDRKGTLQKRLAIELVGMHNSSKYGFIGRFITTFKYSGVGVPISDEELREVCRKLLNGYDFNLIKENLYQCSPDQILVMRDELIKHKFLTAESKEFVDFIQFVFSTTGCQTSVAENNQPGCYKATPTHNNPLVCDLSEYSKIERVPSSDGFKYCFTVPSGMLVLRHNGRINITGNSGKSSFLNQIICQCLDHGENAYLFSGELPNFQAKNWLNFIFAGQRNVTQHKFKDSTYYKVTPEAKQAISDYYRGRLFIRGDGESNKKSDILKSMEDSVRKYGTRLIILDNMTALNLENNDNNRLEKQAEFVNELITFAKKFNVAIILVVHPHKIEMMRRLSKMDVQGISAIIDLAHRIISLYRVQEKEKVGAKAIHADVIIDILKDRITGYENGSVNVYYDKPSKRFFTGESDLDHQYEWDKRIYKTPLPFPPEQLVPNEDDIEAFGETKKP